ncbi:MAG: sulfatase-like hydrolase/transferase, partial [Myxococcota bacterium]
MSQNHYSIPWGSLASLVLLAVLPFLLAEFIAESRITPYWIGLNFNEWLGMLWTGLAYYGAALMITLVIHAALATQPQSAKDNDRIRAGGLTLFHLLATLGSSTLIYYFLQGDALPLIQGDLDLGHRTSLAVVTLAWALHRFNAFAFPAAVIGSLGAVVGSALYMQVHATTLFVRTFGFEPALRSALQFTVIIFGLSVAAAVVGSRKPSWGKIAGFALCWIAIAYPVYKQTGADDRSLQRKIAGPNVLMITADTMRADYLSVYGGDVQTPTLERLAAKGAKFQKAISLAPWTVPAFDGMFSSKFPPSVDPNLPLEVRDKQLTLYGQI